MSVFRKFIKMDKEIETAKQDLSLRPDFNLLDTFRVFDQADRGYIMQADIKRVFNGIGLYAKNYELELFVIRYSKGNSGRLR